MAKTDGWMDGWISGCVGGREGVGRMVDGSVGMQEAGQARKRAGG